MRQHSPGARRLQIETFDETPRRGRPPVVTDHSDRAAKFEEMLYKRLPNVEKALHELGQLGDKDYYISTEEDRRAVINHLRQLVDVVEEKFKKQTNVATSFRLPSRSKGSEE